MVLAVGRATNHTLARHSCASISASCAMRITPPLYGRWPMARLLSNHPLATGERVWINTEADRSSACLLLPVDY